MKPKQNATIRAKMAELSLTQTDVAAALGTTQSVLCRMLKTELPEAEQGRIIEILDGMRNRDETSRDKLHPVHDMGILADIDLLGFELTDVFQDKAGALRFTFEQGNERYDIAITGTVAVSERY